ncbi:TPA: AAA family ATPase, partial [Escherichia coli]
LITGRRQLLEGMAFPPGSTVIVDQGEKLSLKETLTLLDGAARHNVQVLITDSGQRTGTGSALMAMKDAGVNTYRWQGGEQRPATIISEPDRNVRYARLAGDFAASVKAGEESVAQVSGVREQAILTEAIRSELKTQGVLGHPEVTMTALSPVWLDSRSRYLRDMYRPGMVMEQWNPETRSHDRYVIDRVTAQSHSLTLRDAQGETQVVRISSLDSSWSLFRPEKMPVADGERLRVTGKIPGLRVSGGDRLQVASVSEDAMTVVVPGRAEPATLPVADSPFTALKLENGWVETPGHSVSDSATVFASVTQMAMDNATLNGLARSGRDVRLYSSLDEPRTAEKLARQRSGETPDFSNTLFLLDESSMVGNTDMARAYALIAAGGGRAVASGDTDQLQAIAPGQPFRLQQTRSAADVVIMKEIVRQTPELREAVYSLINRDVERALSGLESVKPSQVPRQEGAWAPEHSVTEFSHSQEAKLAEAQQKAMLKGEAFPDIPMTLYEAIVRDYTGRTPEAREQTLIVTHLNEDRRVLNSMIHDAREKAGELGKEQVMVPVLNTANI